jgi:hypothetical protein
MFIFLMPAGQQPQNAEQRSEEAYIFSKGRTLVFMDFPESPIEHYRILGGPIVLKV